MVALTFLTSAAIFLLCFCVPTSLFAVFPEILSLGVLLAGFYAGLRGVAVLLPVCLAILTAAWILEARLAPQLQGRDLRLSGEVCDIPVLEGGVQRFLLVIDSAQRGPGIPERVLISWYQSKTLVSAGERWQLTLRLKRPRGTSNPAGFDFERWAFMRAIGASGYVRQSVANRRLSSAGGGCVLAAFRQQVAVDLAAALPKAAALGHLLALAVGVRNLLDDNDWLVLRRTGSAHLMAISGLHIGLAAGFAFFLCRQLGRCLLLAHIDCRPLVIARAGALTGALLYSALAGFAVPTVRALVMTAAVILLTGLRRSLPPSAILATALYVILWIEPFAMLAPGFWLSFGAVFVLLMSGFGGLYFVAESGTRTERAWSRFRQLLRAQLCISVGLLPASAVFFGQVSLVAPLVNLIIVPLFAVSIVPLLIIGVIALNPSPALASAVLGMADFILGNLLSVLAGLNRCALIPVAVDLPGVSGLVGGICILIAAVLIWPRPLPVRTRVVILLFVLLSVAVTRSELPALRVIVMDVGQGMAILVQTPGYNLLFDTGPRYRHGDAGRSIVIPLLRHYGVMQLDHLIVSHADADHAGGARSVLGSYPGTELLAPELLEVPAERFQRCRTGQHWQRDGVNFRILHPGPEAASGLWSENDASCVLLVQSEQFGLLFPGDIERRAESRLVAGGALPAVDLVIAPHHGSRTSSTPALVATTRPEFVVFSAGHRNRWHFPALEVRKRWSAGGACMLSTGDSGALVFAAHGDGPLQLVERYRVDQARIWTEAGSALPPERRCRVPGATN